MGEIFRITREAKTGAHITHLKVSYTQNWGRMLRVLEPFELALAGSAYSGKPTNDFADFIMT